MATPSVLAYTTSSVNRMPLSARRSVRFYAQLRQNLSYVGVEAISYTRASSGLARWRDGYRRLLGNNVARFEYDETGTNELGLLIEPARTNICLRSEDFSNASWVKTNVTVSANDAGTFDPKGGVTADLLTAVAGNATVIQDLGVVANAPKVFSVFLKRKTGTGNIQLTLDGGSTWNTITVSSVLWTRTPILQTLANPDVGIRIVTNGDEVWAWGAQAEDTASTMTSYIATVAASAARSADVLAYPISNPIALATKTLVWVEDGVSKVNHIHGSPFNSTTGEWSGTNPARIMEIVGFDRVLTSTEIAMVRSEVTGSYVTPEPVPTGENIIQFSQSVSAGNLSVVITHNLGNAGHKIYPTANWLTNISWSSKGPTQTTLNFNVGAPSSPPAVVEGSVEL